MLPLATRPTLTVHSHRARGRLIAASLLCATLVSGCSWLSSITPDVHWVYRPDIQQGVVVTQEMAAQLRTGMTREQVRFVLGTTPLADTFHPNRWDYVYRFQAGKGGIETRRFSVYFENDKMVRSDGDPLPTETEFVANRIKLNLDQARRERGDSQYNLDPVAPSMWDRIKGWFGGSPGASPDGSPPAAPPGPPTTPGPPAGPTGPGDRPTT